MCIRDRFKSDQCIVNTQTNDIVYFEYLNRMTYLNTLDKTYRIFIQNFEYCLLYTSYLTGVFSNNLLSIISIASLLTMLSINKAILENLN